MYLRNVNSDNITNFTKQMHNIYSLHTFYCVSPTCFGVIHHHQGEVMCPLLKTTHSYAATFYGFCNSCVVNIKGTALYLLKLQYLYNG